MKIQIEFIIIFILIIILLCWSFWYRWSLKRLRKNYNPDNDKGRRGGTEQSKNIGGRESTLAETNNDIAGLTQPEERELLPPTNTDDSGKDCTCSRNFFRRFKRKKR